MEFRPPAPVAGSIWTSYIQTNNPTVPNPPPALPKRRRKRAKQGAALPPILVPMRLLPEVVLQIIINKTLQGARWPENALKTTLVSPLWHRCTQLTIRHTTHLSYLPKRAARVLPQLCNLVELELDPYDRRDPGDLALLASHCLRLRRLVVCIDPSEPQAGAYTFQQSRDLRRAADQAANLMAPACAQLLGRLQVLLLSLADQTQTKRTSSSVKHLAVMRDWDLSVLPGPQLSLVVLRGVQVASSLFESLAQQCSQLTTVVLNIVPVQGTAPDAALLLANHCPLVRVLALYGARMSPAALTALSGRHMRVLVGCTWSQVPVERLHKWLQSTTSLEALALHAMNAPTYENISRIVASSPALKYLAIPCPSRMAAMSLLRIAQLRSLLCLALTRWTPAITRASVSSLVKGCVDLRSVVFVGSAGAELASWRATLSEYFGSSCALDCSLAMMQVHCGDRVDTGWHESNFQWDDGNEVVQRILHE